MTYRLAVDLGTTYTAAAVHEDGRVSMVPLGDRADVVPSVVLVRPDDTVLTGDAAARRALAEPECVARDVKRRLGDPHGRLLGGVRRPITDLLRHQLSAVLEEVGARHGGPPERVCLTHPATWGAARRQELREVAERCGVEEPELVAEPDAAAAHYAAAQRLTRGAVVAVYDLGGGTFDATVLRLGSAGAELVGEPDGLDDLGGSDLDDLLLEHVDRSVGGALSALDGDDRDDATALARVRADCMTAKEALSADVEAEVQVWLPSGRTTVRVPRAEFEELIAPLVDRTVTVLERTIAAAGLTPTDLDAVLLVGGSSRVPLVGRVVGSRLGRPVVVDVHPKHAVALGAARLVGAGAPTAEAPVGPAPEDLPDGGSGHVLPAPRDGEDGEDGGEHGGEEPKTAPVLGLPSGTRRRRHVVALGAATFALALSGGAYVAWGSIAPDPVPGPTPRPPVTSSVVPVVVTTAGSSTTVGTSVVPQPVPTASVTVAPVPAPVGPGGNGTTGPTAVHTTSRSPVVTTTPPSGGTSCASGPGIHPDFCQVKN